MAFVACISNLYAYTSIYLSCFVDFTFLLNMLIFFLFLVSGHYGPDAFFNSGCKCMLIFSDYLINHQKLSCLLSLTFWLEGINKRMIERLIFFFRIKIKIHILLFFMFQGQHPYGRRFQQQQKHILILIQFVENPINLVDYFLVMFSSMKIQQKLWKILHVN